MRPRFFHKIECRGPVETEEGTVLISISDRSNQNACLKYPLHDELIKQYRQSSAYRDFVAEGRDACTDPNVFDLGGVAKEKAGSELLNDHPVEISRALKLFSSPVEAFRVAQMWSRARQKKKERFGRAFRERFMEELEAIVPPECAKRWEECNPVTRLRALDAFLGVSISLLKQWVKAGKVSTRWWYENPRDVYTMQHAQEQLRHIYATDLRYVSAIRTSMPWDISLPLDQARLDPDFDLVPIALLGSVYLTNQHSIREAARSASYLVFRKFLMQKIKMSLCAWCGGVFEIGKKTKYCCVYCARCDTSTKVKSADRARVNYERVMAGVEILEDWHEYAKAGRRIPWRSRLEDQLRDRGLIDAHSQASQIVGQWINAAYSVKESHERRRLVQLCTIRRRHSSREGAEAEEMIDKLLALIILAERTGTHK